MQGALCVMDLPADTLCWMANKIKPGCWYSAFIRHKILGEECIPGLVLAARGTEGFPVVHGRAGPALALRARVKPSQRE